MDSVTGIIAANYSTEKLGKLTSERTIASLPYGGRYRLIDFPLSNMSNADIKTVGIITPYKYRSIIDHIGAGKEWSLDRKRGGLFVLPGSVFGISNSESRFLLRDIERNKLFLTRSPSEHVIVAASNTVYNMDYAELSRVHRKSGADMTMVCRYAHKDEPYATELHTSGGRVLGIGHGAKAGSMAFLDCFIINRELLMKILVWYSAVNHLDLFDALAEDYDKLNVRTYEFDGYAEYIYDTGSYYQRSMDLLDQKVSDELFSRNRPILTKVQDTVPTKYIDGGEVKNSLVSAGCIIGGNVEGSVLFRGVRVERDAVVKNCIIMQSCTIGQGAHLENAIIDRRNVIHAGTIIKGSAENTFVKEKSNVKEKVSTGVV